MTQRYGLRKIFTVYQTRYEVEVSSDYRDRPFGYSVICSTWSYETAYRVAQLRATTRGLHLKDTAVAFIP